MTPFFLWISSALAQPATDVEPLPVMEITVWGRLAIDQAEDDIVREMESLGYTTVRKDGRIIFKPPRAWMGAAVWRDGLLTFRRPIAGFQAAPSYVYEQDLRRESGAIDPGGRSMVLSQGGAGLWVFPSRAKRGAQRDLVRQTLAQELAWYDAVVARTAVEELVFGLPDRLDAVWESGTPLEATGGATLGTPKERRRHVLEYWATRADTPAGRHVAAAVSSWLRAVVQTSAYPITDAERTQFESKRPDVLTLPR